MESLKNTWKQLQSVQDPICITISMPTHRVFPDTDTDKINFKNLIKEAQEKLIDRYGKREVSDVLKSLNTLTEAYDERTQLDSVHLFASATTAELVKLPLTIQNNEVIINNAFDTHYIEDVYENKKEFFILLLSQRGARLFDALNNEILSEIENDDFPIGENPFTITDPTEASNAKRMDDTAKAYFNIVDKAVQRSSRITGLQVLVISTRRNFDYLIEVSKSPVIYLGNSLKDYNNKSTPDLAKQAWNHING
ncbi:baeRF3 domain-containing protein [Sediminicola luteus]|uniref:Uncharacterized protein n=1 Tax=Sediminicola luteus TaxID=319238 RepID=A0A2A4G7X6_9FLAO|nr:hypothetical protein [Sediminicola luteus]PCE64064.1 hypothetical protein B7P33_12555 [Sediminicola luteus]